ncbi:MAG: hypothetical protein ACLT47_07700 [Sutterella wadsworthensis]
MAEMKMKETDDVTVVDILESVLVLHVDFDIWTGQSTLTESDMQSLTQGLLSRSSEMQRVQTGGKTSLTRRP